MTNVLTIFRFIFLWSQLLEICVSLQCEMSDMQTFTKNNMRFNFTFKTFSTMGRKMCIKKCLNYPSCLSINFERANLKCELIQFSSEVNSVFLLEESGFEHIIVNKTSCTVTEKKTTSLRGQCNEIICDHVTTRSGQNVCLPEGIRSTFGNVALNKLVNSSSVYEDNLNKYGPMRMTDGKLWSYAITKKENQPWIRIDLDNTYQIDHVFVKREMLESDLEMVRKMLKLLGNTNTLPSV